MEEIRNLYPLEVSIGRGNRDSDGLFIAITGLRDRLKLNPLYCTRHVFTYYTPLDIFI